AEPAARSLRLNRLRADASLLPPQVDAIWTVEECGRRAHLARGPRWTLRAVRWSNGNGLLTVTATTDETAKAVLQAAAADAEAPARDDDETVTVSFWHQTRWAPRRPPRRPGERDRKSTRLNSSHQIIEY